MIITLDGPVAINPHIDKHLLISCLTVADTLALAEFSGEQPYQYWREGWDSSDGRSLTGAIRLKGQSYQPKRRWELALLVSDLGLDLFEQILEVQRQGQAAQITDAWDALGTYPCWLDVGERYRSRVGPDWYLLQFTAREV